MGMHFFRVSTDSNHRVVVKVGICHGPVFEIDSRILRKRHAHHGSPFHLRRNPLRVYAKATISCGVHFGNANTAVSGNFYPDH